MSFKIVGIGELLWDLLPGGKQLGGAPANFTYHARALGADAQLVTRLGRDALGQEALAHITHLGLPVDAVEFDDKLPTSTVFVQLTGEGHPHYVIHEPVAWDNLRGSDAARRAIATADAVCFGTLGQRSSQSRETILSLVRSAPAPSLRILDVNLRQHYFSPELIGDSLASANVLKLNDAELPQLAQMFHLVGDEPAQLRQLAERFALRLVALTRGARGSLLLSGAQWSEHPGMPARIADTVGAGDAFTAAMTIGFLSGWSLDRINDAANRVAAFVCSQSGATPELPESLRAEFQTKVQR